MRSNELRGWALAGQLFGLTGAALGLWFGLYAHHASPGTLRIAWTVAEIFLATTVVLQVVALVTLRRVR